MSCAALRAGAEKLLFVSDYSHRIVVFDIDSGARLRQIGSKGSSNEQFNSPEALTIYHSATAGPQLLISDHFNHRIQVYDALACVYVRTIGRGEGSALGQLKNPNGIAVVALQSPARTWLIVSDYGNNRVQVFDVDSGDAVKVIGSDIYPCDVKVLSQSATAHIFVADRAYNRIRVYDVISGRHLRDIDNGKGSNPGQLNGPTAIVLFRSPPPAAASTGTGSENKCLICVSEYNNCRMSIFDALTGAFVGVLSDGLGSANSQLDHPHGICLI